MIELLTPDDFNIIDAMRERGSSFSAGCYSWLEVKEWLKWWDKAKSEYLNKIFKDDVILRKTIRYDLSEYEISCKINDEVFNDYRHPEARQFIQFKRKFKDAFNYLNEAGYNPKFYAICALMDSDNLASNSYQSQWCDKTIDIPIPHQEKPFRLQTGAKVSKAIGRLCSLMNIDGWEPMRLKISQILNDSHIEGTLCLSIHPMDFMTASVNNNRWSSCMHFYDGEYRRGVIEMMNSPSVICAYVESDSENIDVEGFIWNSKKWREFFIINDLVITGIKGYPYSNQQIETLVADWVRELIIENNVFPEVKWNEEISYYGVNDKVYIEATDINANVPEFDCGPAMYNDFYSGNTYTGYFSDKMLDNCYREIFYSGYSECVVCGDDSWDEYYDDDYAGSQLVCCGCDPTVRCEACGDRYDRDSMYELNGLLYCQYCYNNMPTCDACDEVFDPENGGVENMELAVATVEDHEKPILLRTNLCLCPDCEERGLTEEGRKYDHYYGHSWCNHYYFILDELTEDIKNAIFGTSNDEEIIEQEIGELPKSDDDDELTEPSTIFTPPDVPLEF